MDYTSSLILILIAILFLRNQTRPIVKLSKVAKGLAEVKELMILDLQVRLK